MHDVCEERSPDLLYFCETGVPEECVAEICEQLYIECMRFSPNAFLVKERSPDFFFVFFSNASA